MARRSSRDRGLRYGEGTITERQLPNRVSFEARWVEPSGQRRSKSFPTRDAAEDHLRNVARAKQRGNYVSPSQLTVRELIAQYLERGANRWSSNTLQTYRARADRHILPTLGSARVTDVTRYQLQLWLDRLRRQGLGPATIDGCLRVLVSAFNDAVRLEIVETNPASGLIRPTIHASEVRIWSLNEVRQVLDTIQDDPFWHALYLTALTTGMRPGELRALRWADVDADRGVIMVRRTLSRDDQGRVVMGQTTKTRRARPVAIAAPTVQVLRRWRKAQAERRLATLVWHDDDLVFDRGDGRFLPQTTWQREHEDIIRRAGVPRVTLHGLRHTSASLELAAGTHPRIVADRLGHKDVEITMSRYQHVTAELQRSAADQLAGRLFEHGGDAEESEQRTTTSDRKST